VELRETWPTTYMHGLNILEVFFHSQHLLGFAILFLSHDDPDRRTDLFPSLDACSQWKAS